MSNKHFSYVITKFTPEYERMVRQITAAPKEKDREMPLQDRLLYAFVTVNPVTGQSCEFGWASGRKDAHIIVDCPAECADAAVIETRREFINQLKEDYNGHGFIHGGDADSDRYDGGFEEFPRNFEKSTGRQCPAEIAALCESQRRLAA